jgi:arylformamidase
MFWWLSLYPASDPKAPCFVHIHGGYWQRGSKEIFACLSEGPLARGWSAALCGYTLAPEASLTQITNELKSAFDWLNARAGEHSIQEFLKGVSPDGDVVPAPRSGDYR